MSVSLLANRYELEEQIGSGGMGDVFRGFDKQTGEQVAIKRLKVANLRLETMLIERFEREAEILRQLNHPNIVRVFGKFEAENSHYIVMEYLDKGSLDQVLAQAKALAAPLPLYQVLRIGLDIADALTRAHHLKIIHRDLKPANILYASDGTVRLSDFGIAYFNPGHEALSKRITESGDFLGTLDYMSPESLTSNSVDQRADIWAFGVLLFEMLTGKRPFRAETLPALITSIMTESVPNLEDLRPDAPIGLHDLIYRLLQKETERRIPSMRLVGAELEMLLQEIDPNTPTKALEQIDLAPARPFAETTPPLGLIRTKLPAQLSPFVGREAEVIELKKLLSTQTMRLVTILAQGGMGKTRLALEVARQLAETDTSGNFADGIFFIELAPLSSIEGIVKTIAETIGFNFQDSEASQRQQMFSVLASKKMLLVFDNFEHLLEGTVLLDEILSKTSGIKVLATSREKLNLQGENLLRLSGMDVPAVHLLDHALEYSAIRLFLQTARYAQAGFELKAEELSQLIQICRLLDGLPLGIVLASAWVDTLAISEILQEIQNGLDFLETESRNLPERQRSLRAVFEYSWTLLNEDEKAALSKLAVFRGGFTRDAGQKVTRVSLHTLMALVNKSLLYRNPATGRYSCHELLRQYAEQALEKSGQMQKARDAHSEFFLNFMYEQRSELNGKNQNFAFDQIEDDMENIRTAWAYALDMKHFAAIQKAMSGFVP